MKVFAISDLHLSINNPKPMNIFGEVWEDYLPQIEKSWVEKVGKDDVVLMPGDLSWAMELDGARPDLNYIGSLPGKKVLIRGNHDYWWKSISALRRALPEGVYALQNDSMQFGALTFCGSRGWTIPEGLTAAEDRRIYEREVIRMKMSLAGAAKGRIVVLTHYPPFNYRLEDSPFTRLFEEFGVEKVVYGHLHGKNARILPRLIKNGIEYLLVSCDVVKNTLVEVAATDEFKASYDDSVIDTKI